MAALRRRLRTGDDLQAAAAVRAVFDVDVEFVEKSVELRSCSAPAGDQRGGLLYIRVPALLVRGADSGFVSAAAWAKTRQLRSDLATIEIERADPLRFRGGVYNSRTGDCQILGPHLRKLTESRSGTTDLSVQADALVLEARY